VKDQPDNFGVESAKQEIHPGMYGRSQPGSVVGFHIARLSRRYGRQADPGKRNRPTAGPDGGNLFDAVWLSPRPERLCHLLQNQTNPYLQQPIFIRYTHFQQIMMANLQSAG
jgi:hypothetical protein